MIVVCWKTNLFKKTKEVQFSKNINFTTKTSLKNRLKGLLQGKMKSHVVWFRKRGLLCLKKKEKRRKEKKDSIFDICFEGRSGKIWLDVELWQFFNLNGKRFRKRERTPQKWERAIDSKSQILLIKITLNWKQIGMKRGWVENEDLIPKTQKRRPPSRSLINI